MNILDNLPSCEDCQAKSKECRFGKDYGTIHCFDNIKKHKEAIELIELDDQNGN